MIFIIQIALGILGWVIGNAKNRPILGTLLGLWLGIIGIAIIAFVPAKRIPSVDDKAFIDSDGNIVTILNPTTRTSSEDKKVTVDSDGNVITESVKSE